MPASALFVDGHVHFYECFTWEAFLNAAARHFARARLQVALTGPASGCLVFTESASGCAFRNLVRDGTPAIAAGWRFEPGADGRSILLARGADETLIIVAGRQIVTAERLEVLAVGCVSELPDGRPIRDVMCAVADCGALPVVPWGFGKWLGTRGRIVRQLVEAPPPVPFSLGDNGGRATRLPRPALLDFAERRGVPVLLGSDPLPLPREMTRAGSCGFVLADWPSSTRPAEAIVRRLASLRCSPPVFGHHNTMYRFVRSQVELRWRRSAVPRRPVDTA